MRGDEPAKAMPAYLAAVCAASACVSLLDILPVLFAVWGKVSTAIILSDLVMIPIVFVVVAVMTSVLAFPFVFIAELVANKLEMRGIVYWLGCGAIGGLACGTIITLLLYATFPSVADDGSDVTFVSVWQHLAPLGLAAGVAGGLAFWWIAHRSNAR